MDIKSNKFVDVSSYLLFEATGDSESGCFDPAMSGINHAEDDDQDDDAESCSCDAKSGFVPGVREVNSLEYKGNVGAGGDDDDHHDDDHDHDHDHEDEEEGEVVEQPKKVHLRKKCRDNQRSKGGVEKEKKSSPVSVDSTKAMNEMEKNRLFWEACLAS